MLDRNLLRTNPEAVKAGIARKHMSGPVDEFLAAYEQLHTLKLDLEQKRAAQNQISKTIGQYMAQGKKEEAEKAKAETAELKQALAEGEPLERELEFKIREFELRIPNVPHETAPDGKSSDDNIFVREWGAKPDFSYEPKPHWDI